MRSSGSGRGLRLGRDAGDLDSPLDLALAEAQVTGRRSSSSLRATAFRFPDKLSENPLRRLPVNQLDALGDQVGLLRHGQFMAAKVLVDLPDFRVDLVAYKGVPVMTTEMLAQAYGTEAKNIQMNHANNKARFVAGTHYFRIAGKDLKDFKDSPNMVGSVGKNAASLILWTEKGAARHAKILDTDEAWGVYEQLEDTYFAVKELGTAIGASTKDNRTPWSTVQHRAAPWSTVEHHGRTWFP